jgi:PAS domain S-box-containing protein
MGARPGTTSAPSSSHGGDIRAAPSSSRGGGAEIDARAVSSAAGAVKHIADLLPPDRVVVLAICEPGGTPTDVVVRDRDGQLAVIVGIPEERRPDLAQLLSLAGWTVEGSADRAEYGATARGAEAKVARSRPAPTLPRLGDDLHRMIVEESPLPLLLLDQEGAIAYVSPSVPYDLGWSKAELVGHSLLDFLHPDDRDRAARVMSGAAAAQRLGTAMTLRWRRRHSGYVAVEAAIRCVVGEVGDEVEGAVIALRTNPLQWSGLAEVLLARERQRALADGADSGMAIVSGKESALGVVLEANAPLGRMVGITRGQLAGLPLTSVIAESDAPRLRDALQAVAAEGGTSCVEATVVPRIGRQRLVTITVAASLHSDQPGRELVVRMQDTTEHAGLVAELTLAVDRLERSNEELAALARITAHDLAAPLRAVSGLIDLLPNSGTGPDTRLTFEAIRAAIERMQAMIAGITGYVEARSEEPTRVVVDLNELVSRVSETLWSDVQQRAAKLVVEELPSVFGDEHQLERVFLNLISNALKYSGEQLPEIKVYANRTSEGWRISVADNGLGVEESERDRIFELFARGRVGSGSGIGLATCWRIVELHGGRIWVQPNEPTGSIFSFTLPHEPTVVGG